MRWDRRVRVIAMLIGGIAACARPGLHDQASVTIAIVGGRVWTGEPAQPWAEAVALAGDRVIAVGSTTTVRRMVSSETRVIDARGGMVVPGFIDAHVHFLTGGMNLASVQLRDASTPAEFAARIKAFAATLAPGTWITGGDYGIEGGIITTIAIITSTAVIYFLPILKPSEEMLALSEPPAVAGG